MNTLLRADRKDDAFLQAAMVIGSLSTCDRASVGAIIVRDGRCVSWGYNGAPPGLPRCDENNHGWGTNPEEWHKDPVYALGGI
jgi:deoxycytidylate deaminase